MADDKVAALEQLAMAQNEAIQLLVQHVRALALVNAALVGTLDDASRAVVREAALGGLGAGPEHAPAAALIGLYTRDPVAVLADQAAVSTAVAGSTGRLQ